jgi:hypothetical protein
MFEIFLEDILTKIKTQPPLTHHKQISLELGRLGRLIIRDYQTPIQISYCSSKIFDSELSLFDFLNINASNRNYEIADLRKEVLDIICDYVQVAKYHLINFIAFIRDSTLGIFKKDCSEVVKEAALKVIVKLLQSFEADILAPIVKVETLAHMMLDEIKFLKPKPGVRGRIWQILGELIKKFPNDMKNLKDEIQELSFPRIQEIMEKLEKKECVELVEFKTLKGLLQVTRAILEVTTYPSDERRNC